MNEETNVIPFPVRKPVHKEVLEWQAQAQAEYSEQGLVLTHDWQVYNFGFQPK